MNNIDYIPNKFYSIVKQCLDQVADQVYSNFILNNCIIAGGCIVSEINNRGYNDIDVFFKNLKAARLFLKGLGVSESQYTIIEEKGENPRIEINDSYCCRVSNATKNSITFDKSKCQFIFVNIGSPSYIMNMFDLDHVKSYIDCETKKIHFTPEAITSMASKSIQFSRNLKYPIKSFSRAIKYSSRGFQISYAEYLWIITKIIEKGYKLNDIIEETVIDKSQCDKITKHLQDFKSFTETDPDCVDLAIKENKIPTHNLDIRS